MGLTTVAAVKSFLSIESTADDALIASIIGAESELIEAYIDRSVAVKPWSDIFGGGGNCEHRFRQSPVQAITRVMIDGMEIAEAGEITERGYLLDDGRLLLFGYCFAWGRNNCRIDYTAGWTAVPEAIAHACLELVSYRYRNKDRVGLMSKVSPVGETTSFSQKEMPDHVRLLLNQYRRVVR
ncbi:MAG: hypothetical protein HGB04_06550 [Chlorobiaceae bacterium]|nr:hypothetical protein [Chlorobiaceae bacterium]